MRKKVFGRKLGRERDSRRALFRSLIRSFAAYGKITTTKAKAKAIQPDIEKLVNMAKVDALSNIRRLHATLGNDGETAELIVKAAKAFGDRKSGFTRIINLPRRIGDYAETVRLEWSEKIEVVADSKGSKSSKSTKSSKGNKKLDAKDIKTEKTEEPKKKTLKDRLSSLRKKK